MKLGTIGYYYSHNSDFVMDRPNGPGCWLMLIDIKVLTVPSDKL